MRTTPQTTPKWLFPAMLACITLFSSGCGQAASEQETVNVANGTKPAAAAAAAAATSVDGPYVSYTKTGDATVRWVVDRKVQTEQFANADTLRITPPRGSELGLDEIVIKVAQPPAIEPAEFDDVERIFIVGDIHGQYMGALKLLRAAGVIDARNKWSFGDGHLVINGDVLDRGDRVTEALWFIHQLEPQARDAGGYVHFVLGNHEAMIMRGDMRNVNKERYVEGSCEALGTLYRFLFTDNTEFGRWLRTKHAMLRINDLLFVHGGIGPTFAARNLTIGEANRRVKWALNVERGGTPDRELEIMLERAGPLWYRGYFNDQYSEPVSESQLDAILEQYQVSRIVVGHTHVENVCTVLNGRVIATCLPVENGVQFQGLLIESGEFTVVHADGTMRPLREAPQASETVSAN